MRDGWLWFFKRAVARPESVTNTYETSKYSFAVLGMTRLIYDPVRLLFCSEPLRETVTTLLMIFDPVTSKNTE